MMARFKGGLYDLYPTYRRDYHLVNKFMFVPTVLCICDGERGGDVDSGNEITYTNDRTG